MVTESRAKQITQLFNSRRWASRESFLTWMYEQGEFTFQEIMETQENKISESDGVDTSGSILHQISKTTLHILLACMSGAGKSTTLRAILGLILADKPDARFYIVDPKTSSWMGLEQIPGVVTYLSGDTETQLCGLASVVDRVFNELDRRIDLRQQALRKAGSVPDFEDLYLVIDEWYVLYDLLNKTSDKVLKEWECDRIMSGINAIIAKGRELKVHLFLVSQTHLATETGISTAMRRSLAVICQGFIAPNGDGGYASIDGAIKDSNLFPTDTVRKRLERVLETQGKRLSEEWQMPLLLTTMGTPRLCIVPRIEGLDKARLNYKHRGTVQPMPEKPQRPTTLNVVAFRQPELTPEFDHDLYQELDAMRSQGMSITRIVRERDGLTGGAKGSKWYKQKELYERTLELGDRLKEQTA